MIINSKLFKDLLKKVSGTKAENVIFAPGLLIGSDNEVTIAVQFPDGVEKPFSTNLRKLSSVVNRMSGDIAFDYHPTSLILKSSKATVEFEIQESRILIPKPAADFITLPTKAVKELLKFTVAATDSNKAAQFGGVVQLKTLVQGFEDQTILGLKSAGTDSKRLAFQDVLLKGISSDFNHLIPLPGVQAFVGSITAETFTLGETTSHFVFSEPGVTVYASKLQKSYPNYEAFIPKEFKYELSIKAEDVRNSLGMISPFISADFHNGIDVHFLDGSATFKTPGNGSNAKDSVEFTQIVPEPIFDSLDLKMRLDHRFLSDFFGAVSGEVLLKANAPNQPILLQVGDRTLMIAAMAEK